MFLATTALTVFWDTADELLCLGPWCLRYDLRQEWEGLRYRVLPSPWEDRARFSDAIALLDTCGERMLGWLTEYLNAVHHVSHGMRYWRILIGTWLIHDLHAAYDRYVHLTDAFARVSSLRTIVMDPGSFRVPRDTIDFITSLQDDAGNLQMVSEQLAHLGYTFPRQAWTVPQPSAGRKPQVRGWREAIHAAQRLGIRLAERTAHRLRHQGPYAALYEMSGDRSWFWALAWRSRLRAIPREIAWGHPLRSDPVFDERRQGLRTLPASSEFERIVVRSLPNHFPTMFLEGYRAAVDAVGRTVRQPPPVVVSAMGWHYHEPFKFLAAEASVRGSRLIAVQHGGGYGLLRHAPMEQHERRAADTFFGWGWADGVSGNHLGNLPSPRLSRGSRASNGQRMARASTTLLFVSAAHQRYLNRFHSYLPDIHTPAYLDWQIRFLRTLPDYLRRVVRFRPYPEEFGYAVREQIARRVGPLYWDGHRPFAQALNDTRLVVIDHAMTTFLEALRHGVPTVLFWDPRLAEVRKDAEPSLNALRSARILHDSPEDAVAHVAAVYDDPGRWWSDANLQLVRRQFIQRYAWGCSDWLRVWDERLQEELTRYGRSTLAHDV